MSYDDAPDAESVASGRATGNVLDDLQTWRARLSGKDQALTRLQQQHRQYVEAAEARDAEHMAETARTRAELGEALAALQEQLAAAQAERDAARTEMLRLRYPTTAGLFPGEGLPAGLGEEQLAVIESRLAQYGEEYDPPTPIDPNNPRRPFVPSSEKPLSDMTSDELVERLRTSSPSAWTSWTGALSK